MVEGKYQFGYITNGVQISSNFAFVEGWHPVLTLIVRHYSLACFYDN